MACGINNGNAVTPTEFGDEYLKIVVIGERRCGKTTFIRACLHHTDQQAETSNYGVKVYPCEFELTGGTMRLVALYEIPASPDVPLELKIPHYEKAHVIVFMYAIDDPQSFEMLSSRWIPETSGIVDFRFDPIALVGTKEDLRNNQQVIQRLALNNQVPVTPEQTGGFFGPNSQRKLNIQISSHDLNKVLERFTDICNLEEGALL